MDSLLFIIHFKPFKTNRLYVYMETTYINMQHALNYNSILCG